MSYIALYRKFRPDSFEEVKGQDHIVTTLRNQVMHDRVGIGERITHDYPNFPTERANWYYTDQTCTEGRYYNGTDYLPTIEFYGSCDTIADTEYYLATQAGLNASTVRIETKSHYYAIIQAKDIWYNADAFYYMYPGCNGLDVGGCRNPSAFKEGTTNFRFHYIGEEETAPNEKSFTLSRVFRAGDAVFRSENALYQGALRLRGECSLYGQDYLISPDKATYESSDESVISFDNEKGTGTLHGPGTTYITITYENQLYGEVEDVEPTFTTTIKITSEYVSE